MIEIRISGPGGTINFPYEIVVDALRKEGIDVRVVNDCPEENADAYCDMIRERINSGHSYFKVHVVAEHEPWGG